MKHKLGLQLQDSTIILKNNISGALLYLLTFEQSGFYNFLFGGGGGLCSASHLAQQVFNHPLSCQNIGVLLNIFVSKINYNP